MNTEIIVITDRSGSMHTIADDVIGGYNNFIEEQRKVPGEARVTYVQFDHLYECVYEGKPLSAVPKLDVKTFQPRGSTALFDAVGRTLAEQRLRLLSDPWADLVVVCILTDGHENSSREYTRQSVQQLTAEAETKGWKFVYLGANQDAFAVSKDLGMRKSSARTFKPDEEGVREVYAWSSQLLYAFRTRRTVNQDSERSASKENSQA